MAGETGGWPVKLYSERTSPVWGAAGLALALGLVSLARDGWLLWGYGLKLSHDSAEYIQLAQAWFDFSQPFAVSRTTLPYLFMVGLARAWQGPWALLAMQVVLAGLAVGALVYVLARRDRWLALTVGAVLACDLVWGGANRAILMEGPLTSLSLLALAWFISHYDRRERLGAVELALAGAFYGLVLFFRPSNIFLMPVLVLAYWWLARRWSRAAWLALGMALFLLAACSMNLARSGRFALFGQSGDYLVWPLIYQELFDPNNGPASKELDQALSRCMPPESYRKVTYLVSPSISNLQSCLDRQGMSYRRQSELWQRAFVEAMASRPLDFAGMLVSESAGYLAYPTFREAQGYWLPPWHRLAWWPGVCGQVAWCPGRDFTPRASLYAWPVAWFDALSPYTMQLYLNGAFLSVQDPPRLAATVALKKPRGAYNKAAWLAAIGWLVMAAFLLTTTHGRRRFVVLAGLLYVHYTILTIVGLNVFLPRYSCQLSPWYSLLSVAALVQLEALIRRAWARRAAREEGAP